MSPALISRLLPEDHRSLLTASPGTAMRVNYTISLGGEKGETYPQPQKPPALLHSPAFQCWKGSESDWGAACFLRRNQPVCRVSVTPPTRGAAQIH